MNFPNAINSPTASDLARKTIVELANYVYLTAVAYSGNAEYAEQFLRELAAQAQSQIDALVDVAASYASDAETARNNAVTAANRAESAAKDAEASVQHAKEDGRAAGSVAGTQQANRVIETLRGQEGYDGLMPLRPFNTNAAATVTGTGVYYRPIHVCFAPDYTFPPETTKLVAYDLRGRLQCADVTGDDPNEAVNWKTLQDEFTRRGL